MNKFDLITFALKNNYNVLYSYDLMGCLEITKINKKSFTYIDITNKKGYININKINDFTKYGFKFILGKYENELHFSFKQMIEIYNLNQRCKNVA